MANKVGNAPCERMISSKHFTGFSNREASKACSHLQTDMKSLGNVSVVLIVVFAMTTGLLQTGFGQKNSPLYDLYRTYREEIPLFRRERANSADPQKFTEEFHEKWLNSFYNALARADEQDPGRIQVLYEVLALETALGRLDIARKTNELLIRLAEDKRAKARLSINLSEIAYLEYAVQGTNADITELERHFETAHSALRDEARPLTVLGFFQKYGDFLESLRKYDRASRIYAEAVEWLEKANREEREQLGQLSSTYTEEWFLARGVAAGYRGEDKMLAEYLFRKLIALPNLKRPRSYHFYSMAGVKDPQYGPVFRQMTEKWLSEEDPDEWTPFLKFYLARSYFEEAEFLPALRLYEDLSKTTLAQPTPEDRERQAGGYAAEIMYNFATCLQQAGMTERARELFRSFREIFKKEVR